MHILICDRSGFLFHARGDLDFQRCRPCFCFVPELYFSADGFNRNSYIASRWPKVNCAANPLAIGSHVFPDPDHPVEPGFDCPILTDFLTRIEIYCRTAE